MPRPYKHRRISEKISGTVFKPAGKTLEKLDCVQLQLDELEALRLAHIYGLTHKQGAEEMGVSRSTFGRIISSASRKITEALLNDHALQINGGPVFMAKKREFRCRNCGNEWEEPFGTGRPAGCPQCNSSDFFRIDSGPKQVGCRKKGGSTKARNNSSGNSGTK